MQNFNVMYLLIIGDIFEVYEPKIARKTLDIEISEPHMQQGNSVARDLPPTGSEANTTNMFYTYWI